MCYLHVVKIGQETGIRSPVPVQTDMLVFLCGVYLDLISFG